MQNDIPDTVPPFSRAPDKCYSARNWHSLCESRFIHRASPDGNGGRGPPQRAPRSELQAMSNSLQLTSS